jgi:hypothetical protein
MTLRSWSVRRPVVVRRRLPPRLDLARQSASPLAITRHHTDWLAVWLSGRRPAEGMPRAGPAQRVAAGRAGRHLAGAPKSSRLRRISWGQPVPVPVVVAILAGWLGLFAPLSGLVNSISSFGFPRVLLLSALQRDCDAAPTGGAPAAPGTRTALIPKDHRLVGCNSPQHVFGRITRRPN